MSDNEQKNLRREIREYLRREIKFSTENLKAFMKFLLLKGLATKTDDGEIVINNNLSEEVFEAFKEFYRKREKK